MRQTIALVLFGVEIGLMAYGGILVSRELASPFADWLAGVIRR